MTANSQPPSPAEFFVAGGTLPASAPSYVSRPADEQLFNAALAGEFCYVLTTRQMGKSSLMVRTADRLKERGIRTAIVDLTGIGHSAEDTWYLDFLTVLADKLALDQDVEAWWRTHAGLGAVLRFRSFLRDVVLTEIGGQIVIFVDEIDSTLGLPFADDFFAAVRATYNERADDAQFKRLTFIFLGVAAPADLIKDRTRTPFNIGQGILLRDFDRMDAAVLQQGLDAAYPGQGKAILDRVYDWTSGHPYLTQRLCREVVDRKPSEPWTAGKVDQVVNDLFLSDQTNREQNLQFVQDRVLKNPHRRELLKLYSKVRAGRPVANDEQSVLQNQLKLAGLVTTEDGALRVHNEIYRVVFDAKWIMANTPRDTNRLVAIAAVGMAVLVVALAIVVVWYNSVGVQAEARQLEVDFFGASDPQKRVEHLAQLFKLQGVGGAPDFDNDGRQSFFNLSTRQEQLDLFQKGKGESVIVVIRGLYTTLADVDRSGDTTPLLQEMLYALNPLPGSMDINNLRGEMNSWLQGREKAAQDQGDAALQAYNLAIGFNAENAATRFERARVYQEQDAAAPALDDLEQVIALARRAPVAQSTPTPAVGQQTILTPRATSNALTVTPQPTTAPRVIPTPGATSPPPSAAALLPFKSQFMNFVQIVNAVKNRIDSSPNLAALWAKSSESDYRNLREAGLVPSCGGAEAEGLCWYFGEANVSCEAVCANRGGYDAATRTYAGSDGSASNCRNIFRVLNIPLDDFFETTQGGLGCFAILTTTGNYFGYWDTQPTTAAATSVTPGRRRICGCQR
jgi:hypothetical protein